MGFETPLALLFGMLAAALPFLAHRMRKRELPRVLLPTFALIARAAAQSKRKRTLQDLLLLALRISILVIASFAIAAPFVTARVPFGDGRVAALAIVIDDSLSMSRRDGNRTLFAQALARAELIAQTLPAGSEVSIVLGGRPARVVSPMDKDLGGAVRKLEAQTAAPTRAGDLDAAIALGARELARSSLSVRRLLVLSDFAKHASLDPATLELDGVDVLTERVGQATKLGNAFIESVSAAADPTQPGTTSVAVEIRSKGDVPRRASVELLRGGSVISSGEVALAAGSGKLVLHVSTPEEHDDPRAQLRLRIDDALDADNVAGVVLTRADAVRVLLVNGDPHPASDDDELRYLSRALAAVPEALLSIAPRTVDTLSFAHTELGSQDVVVLANVPAPTPELVRRLKAFVEQGGGLIVAAGHRVDAPAYNAALGELLAAHVNGLAPAQDVRFALATGSSFLADGLAGLHEARTTQRLLLDACAEPLLAFDDGLPALCAREVGDGRVLLFATSLDADYGDLPFRPGFVPLTAALIRYAAGAGGGARGQVVPGDVLVLPMPRRAALLEVQRPGGEAERLPAKDGVNSVRYTTTEEIGAYRVRSANKGAQDKLAERGAFVVQAPADESDLSPGPVPAPSRASARAAQNANVHRSLAPLVFALVGLFVLAEGLVRLRKR